MLLADDADYNSVMQPFARRFSVIAILWVAGLLAASSAQAVEYWVCVDAQGQKSAQDFPCPSTPAEQQTPRQTPSAGPAPEKSAAKPKSKQQPLQLDYFGVMLKPLLPWLGAIVAGLAAIVALKALLVMVLRRRRTEGESDSDEPSISQDASPPTVWTLALINALEWKRFEELCAGYWRHQGYKAELTSTGADGGVDVRLYAPENPAQLFAVIQCKARSAQSGVAPLRELWGVCSHLKVSRALFYSRAGFTDEARMFAKSKSLQLFTGVDLLGNIKRLSADQQRELLEEVTRGDYTTPTCSQCDVKMVLRQSQQGSHAGENFWGCVNYPQCQQTMKPKRGT